MDVQKNNDLRAVAAQQVKNAEKYADARYKAGMAERDLKIILAAHLRELRGNKKNLGVEMAILMLMETNDMARSIYSEWMENEAIYKGMEKVMEAGSSMLILEQSLSKNEREGAKYG